jgi:hypothetical protein
MTLYAINRMLRGWARSHVGREVFVRAYPSFANSDWGSRLTSVEMPVLECRINTAPDHRFPNIVKRLFGSESSPSTAKANLALNGAISICSSTTVLWCEFMSMLAEVGCSFTGHIAILHQKVTVN